MYTVGFVIILKLFTKILQNDHVNIKDITTCEVNKKMVTNFNASNRISN